MLPNEIKCANFFRWTFIHSKLKNQTSNTSNKTLSTKFVLSGRGLTLRMWGSHMLTVTAR